MGLQLTKHRFIFLESPILPHFQKKKAHFEPENSAIFNKKFHFR